MEVLDAALLARRLRELAPLAAIYLSGGEPFEHPDFVDIASTAAGFAQQVVAYSSGTARGGDKLRALSSTELARVGRWLTRIDFSVYAMTANVHDSVTREPGSLDCVLESIALVRALGIPFGIHYIPVFSGEHLMSVAHFARHSRASRFHVLALAPQGRASGMTLNYSGEFLAKLRLLSTLDLDLEVVISSVLRRLIGVGATARDMEKAAFVDVHGNVYPGEGSRVGSLRSLTTIVETGISELLADS